jgi:hypothetical protein
LLVFCDIGIKYGAVGTYRPCVKLIMINIKATEMETALTAALDLKLKYIIDLLLS